MKQPWQNVTLLTTLLRTVSLVTLTFFLAFLVRIWSPARHLVQLIAGSEVWLRFYSLFHIETALGREQVLLSVIILLCFCVALAFQLLFLTIKEWCSANSSACHDKPGQNQ